MKRCWKFLMFVAVAILLQLLALAPSVDLSLSFVETVLLAFVATWMSEPSQDSSLEIRVEEIEDTLRDHGIES